MTYSSGSLNSTISMSSMFNIIEQLRAPRHRESTRANYYTVWKVFNRFFVRLDHKPRKWKDCILIFVAFMIKGNRKSTMIKSYVSAIKVILAVNNIKIQEDKFLLSLLTRACRLKNDVIHHRFPIHRGLLHLILKTIHEEIGIKDNQGYLSILYKAMFISGYYGLLRVGEMAKSPHVIKAKDIHIGTNKSKIMFILHSSKTHSKADKPQIIKIKGKSTGDKKFCPFVILRQYLSIRNSRRTDSEQFFIFREGSPVLPVHMRNVLYRCLVKLEFNPRSYGLHCLWSGHVSDMLKSAISVETIKKIGHWRSNAVYTYLCNL